MAHQQSNDTDQSKPLLDERGKFAKGNIPPAGFNKHPENRNPGGWKKEDTPRFKLEQMMKLKSSELEAIVKDDETPLFDKKLAVAIKDGKWKELESMIVQVYGYPKQTIEQTNLTPPEPLEDLRKEK